MAAAGKYVWDWRKAFGSPGSSVRGHPPYLGDDVYVEAKRRLEESVKELGLSFVAKEPVTQLPRVLEKKKDSESKKENSRSPRRKRTTTKNVQSKHTKENSSQEQSDASLLDKLDPFKGIDDVTQVVPIERYPYKKRLSDEAKYFSPLIDLPFNLGKASGSADVAISNSDVEDIEDQQQRKSVSEMKKTEIVEKDSGEDTKHSKLDKGTERMQLERRGDLELTHEEKIAFNTEMYRKQMQAEGISLPTVTAATANNRLLRAKRYLRECSKPENKEHRLRRLFDGEQGDAPSSLRLKESCYLITDGNSRLLPYSSIQEASSNSCPIIIVTQNTKVGTTQRSMLQLSIQLANVEFDDHPVYGYQDLLAVQAAELFQEYQARIAIDLVGFYTSRIKALAEAADRHRRLMISAKSDGDPTTARYNRNKLRQILEASLVDREHRDQEEYQLRQLFKSLYEAWTSLRDVQATDARDVPEAEVHNVEGADGKDLKEVRDDSLQKTPLVINNLMQVKVKKVQLSKAEEQKVIVRDLEDEVRTREELWHLDHSEMPSAVQTKTRNPPEYRRIVEARLARCRKRPGRPLYVPVLRPSAISLTPTDHVGIEEKARRKREEEARVYLIMRVNGRVVMRTGAFRLERKWPRLVAPLSENLLLRLHAPPRSVEVDVFQQGIFSGYKLATCKLKLPYQYSFNPKNEAVEFEDGSQLPNLPQPGKGNSSASGEKLSDSHKLRQVRGKLSVSMRWLTTGDGKDTHEPHNKKVESLENKLQKESRRRREATGGFDLINLNKVEFKVYEAPAELLLAEDEPESLRKQVLRGRHLGLISEAACVPMQDTEIPAELLQSAISRSEVSAIRKQKWDEDALKGPRVETSDVVHETIPPFMSFDFLSTKLFNFIFEARRLLRPLRVPPPPIANPISCRLMVQIVQGQNLPVKIGQADLSDGQSRVWVEVSFGHARRRTSTNAGANPSWNELVALPLKPSPGGGFSPSDMLALGDEEVVFTIFDRSEITRKASGRARETITVWEEQYLGRAALSFRSVYLCRPVYAPLMVTVPPQSLNHKVLNPRAPSRIWAYVTLDPPLALPHGYSLGQGASEPPQHWWIRSPFHKYCKSFLRRAHRLSRSAAGVDGLGLSADAVGARRHIELLAPNFDGDPILCCRFVCPLQPPKDMEDPAKFMRFVATVPNKSDDWRGDSLTDEAKLDQGGYQKKTNSGKVFDCWCTAEEFLTLGWGDEEEHALLLCGYFKYRESVARTPRIGKETPVTHSPEDWQTYVCSGRGSTGLGVYWVLRIGPPIQSSFGFGHQRRVLAYDPVNGHRYDIYRDYSIVPLSSIGSIFDEANVWANIQGDIRPWRNEFDLSNRNHWLPLFHRFRTRDRYANHLGCVQPPISYVNVGRRYFETRATEIERIIEQRFERWRSEPTIWDYGVAGVLRDALPTLELAEQAAGVRGPGRAVRETKALQRVKAIYKGIHGFPLNFKDCPAMPHTVNAENNPIVEEVRQSRLHDRRTEGNRFALAVYIHPYPNHIGSCWVYIAALPPDRRGFDSPLPKFR